MVYLLFTQDNRTHPLPLHDGAVLGLETNMVIGKDTSQYFVSDLNNAVFPHLLQPWVSDELSNKETLLADFRNSFYIQGNKIINGIGSFTV